MASLACGCSRVPTHLPPCLLATSPPLAHTKLRMPLVKSLGAAMPGTPFLSWIFLAAVTRSAHVFGGWRPRELNQSLWYQTARTPPYQGAAYVLPASWSLARAPLLSVLPSAQEPSLPVMSANAPCSAHDCTSVLPTSVTSGPAPLAIAVWNFWVACGQGMYWTCTAVFGCFWRNSAVTPSRNFVCSGLPSPICQTTIFAGSAPLASSFFLSLPQPVTATASATAAAAALVYLTMELPSVPPDRLTGIDAACRTRGRLAPAYSRGCGSAGLWGNGLLGLN